MSTPETFIHRFEPATAPGLPPLLLLHGTGGDENDLLPLGHTVAPGAALLSPRGLTLEAGMPRFFRRLAEGIFDEDDLRRRTHELADFVEQARAEYGLPAPIALGFSNGANIAAAMLLLRPEVLSGAVLLRAMSPFVKPPVAALTAKSVLIVSGSFDPIIPEENAARLATTLGEAGAAVEHRSLPTGHGLSQADLGLVRNWFAQRPALAA
ncbi:MULTISPECIES: alpha/beta hydrolase [unclassified Bosea (in: a-proteobacteria)]|uniref:alpha/beta hydrolase n=1 Tax=unclassified Bosea (in: a-proteobacteria) TaxID=2653178 RepID=UPI000F74C65D|nr:MULTISPECIES: alpha/beta hydrolase [unclassified Bosea (in: a-proteobacteria)]AZO77912.1 hydrolase [Bosea sp. Tri-49]RXT19333.1 hydrolase [Bosea sp. Tri-39]RXT41605.1 hydrolase [Bosea sp. Tri-54]